MKLVGSSQKVHRRVAGGGGRFKHPLLEYGRKEKKINLLSQEREKDEKEEYININLLDFPCRFLSLSLSLRAMRSFF